MERGQPAERRHSPRDGPLQCVGITPEHTQEQRQPRCWRLAALLGRPVLLWQQARGRGPLGLHPEHAGKEGQTGARSASGEQAAVGRRALRRRP